MKVLPAQFKEEEEEEDVEKRSIELCRKK